MAVRDPSPSLYNEDLAPAEERRWGAFSIFNVWTSDVHSLWGYYLAASLFLLCGSFINFVIAIGIGSLVIFFLMSLVGNAGVRTGVPFPVLARASFGTFGANVPALVRAVVACFWYGAQTAAASGAIVALLVRNESMLAFHQNSHMLGHSTLEVICYVVVWSLQLLIIQRGMETVRKFQDWAGPAVWVMMLILAVYLIVKSGTFSFGSEIPRDVLIEKTKDAGVPWEPGSFPALAAVAATWITYFAALYLNFCDFSRYATDEKTLRKGNLWGLPINLLAFCLVAGVTTTAAPSPRPSTRTPRSSTGAGTTTPPLRRTTSRWKGSPGSSMAISAPSSTRVSIASPCTYPEVITIRSGGAITPRARPRYPDSAVRSSIRPRGSP